MGETSPTSSADEDPDLADSTSDIEKPQRTESTDGTLPSDGAGEYHTETWVWGDTKRQPIPSDSTDEPDHQEQSTESTEDNAEPHAGESTTPVGESVSEMSDEERITQALTDFDPDTAESGASNAQTVDQGLLGRLLRAVVGRWLRQLTDGDPSSDETESVTAEGSVGVSVGEDTVDQEMANSD